MYKYTILTFIIGKNYQKVHQIKNKQQDVQYLLVTDDQQLKSETWKVIYDETLNKQCKNPFDKCFRIRYNVFKYASTDVCVTIDGSMEIKGSLDKLINKFNNQNYDICLMPHPLWADFINQQKAWIQMRGYPVQNAQKFLNFMNNVKYDLNYQGLFQLCFSIKRKTKLTKDIDKLSYSFIQLLSQSEQKTQRLDQTIFSYVMNRYFNDIKVLPVSQQVVRSYAIQWYWHNSDKPNMNIFYDINKPDYKWMFNKRVQCYYLK